MSNNLKWNKRFIELCEHVSTWSRDPSTKVSAIIVDAEHNVRALGFNGLPRGVDDTTERLENRDLKYPMTVHAELNAISTCSRLGIRTEGCYIVCTHFPCSSCCGSIIQAGIVKVIVPKSSEDFLSRWQDTITLSKQMFDEAGVELVVIDMDQPTLH